MEENKSLLQKFKNGLIIIFCILFIFAIGLIYAYIRPEELLIRAIFLIIVIGWIAFSIRLIWDMLDKKSKKGQAIENISQETILANVTQTLDKEQITENTEKVKDIDGNNLKIQEKSI